MEIKIMKPDDSQQYFLTEVHIPFNQYKGNYQRGYGNGQIYPSSFRSEHEPTIAAIKVWLMGSLGLGRRGRGDFNQFIVIGDKDDGLKCIVSKIGTRYHLMGEMQAKDTILTALARTIYKS